jgi:hypothetical protein
MIPPTLVSLRTPLPGPVLVLPSSAAPDERVRAEAAAVTRARRTPSALASRDTPQGLRAFQDSRTQQRAGAPGQLLTAACRDTITGLPGIAPFLTSDITTLGVFVFSQRLSLFLNPGQTFYATSGMHYSAARRAQFVPEAACLAQPLW